MKNKTLYIVLGIHRSGTSLTAKMIETLGIPFGESLIGPAHDNKKGFMEDADIVAFNEQLLEELGVCWDSLNGFFYAKEHFNTKKFRTLINEAKSLVTKKFSSHNKWGIKDPRISRLLPFWEIVCNELKLKVVYIFPFRSPADVQASLAARNNFNDIKSGWLWFLYNIEALTFIQDKKWILINYDSIIKQPELELDKVRETLNIDTELITASRLKVFCHGHVDKNLQHQKNLNQSAFSPSSIIQKLYSALLNLEAKQLTNTEFNIILHKIYQEFRNNNDLPSLIDFCGRYERNYETTLQHLYQEHAQQFNDFHNEEQKLIGDVQELKQNLDKQFIKIKQQKDHISNLKEKYNELTQSVAKVDEVTNKLEESQQQIKSLEKQHSQLELNRKKLHKNLEIKKASIKEKDKQIILANKTLQIEQQTFSETIANQQHEFELEKKRLWDIVEKYRSALENNNGTREKASNTLNKTVAGILKIDNGADKSIFFLLKHRLKLTAISLLNLLPGGLILKRSLVRLKHNLNGKFSEKSLRLSHYEITKNRQGQSTIVTNSNHQTLPDIDLTVVSHNNGQWIRAFMKSLTKQNFPVSKISFIIVDNGSTDDTVGIWKAQQKELQSEFKSFKIICNKNLGFGNGQNEAFKNSDSPFVLVSNIDLEFSPDAIINALSYATSDKPSVASWELRQQPYEHPKFYDPVSLETAWSSHACVLIRRSCFEHVKGYEKRIFMYGEDVELSYRFRAFGYTLKYYPKSVVYHHTYKEASEIKPLQFSGSTLANSYIRLRYGTLLDIIKIPLMHIKLLSVDVGISNSRNIILNNFCKLIKNIPYFLCTRYRRKHNFAFRNWDYEMIRDGSFYEPPTYSLAKNTPLVSIITRTYIGRDFWLKEALTSVLNQTYNNIEIVVVEDGSSSMQTLVSELSSINKSVSLIYKPLPKKGRCYAGNKGLELANGKYVMFLDDDDLLFCDHVETAIHELESDKKISAAYALSWDVQTKLNSEDINEGYIEMSHSTSDVLRQEFDRKVLQHHNYISIQSIVFLKTLFEEHGGFDEELENLEDWNLWVKYSINSEFKHIQKTTSMFRTPWGISEKSKRQSILDSYYTSAVEKNKKYILAHRD